MIWPNVWEITFAVAVVLGLVFQEIWVVRRRRADQSEREHHAAAILTQVVADKEEVKSDLNETRAQLAELIQFGRVAAEKALQVAEDVRVRLDDQNRQFVRSVNESRDEAVQAADQAANAATQSSDAAQVAAETLRDVVDKVDRVGDDTNKRVQNLGKNGD